MGTIGGGVDDVDGGGVTCTGRVENRKPTSYCDRVFAAQSDDDCGELSERRALAEGGVLAWNGESLDDGADANFANAVRTRRHL